MGLWNYLYTRVERRLSREPGGSQFPMSDFKRLRHEIKPCDVILVESKSKVAEVIKLMTASPWSHAALYLGRLHDIGDPVVRQKVKDVYDGQPDVQLLIESQLGLGTVVRPLNVYETRHLRICRPREISYDDAQAVIKYAVNRLGSEYDMRQIWDLARFYFPWGIMPRRFRSSLFEWQPGSCTKTVCSTMLSEAFAFINFPVLPLVKRVENGKIKLFQRNPKLNTPSDFDYSPYFDIIKYPFMSFNSEHDARYRLMPWNEEGDLSKEESLYYVDKAQQMLPDHRDPFKRSIDEKENL